MPKLGPKAYEQCAGFMRIQDGKNPLDATGVHPESYKAAEKLLDRQDLNPRILRSIIWRDFPLRFRITENLRRSWMSERLRLEIS